MEILTLFSSTLLIIFLITHTHTVVCVDICKPTICNPTGPTIRFPFRLIGKQPRQCGYPGFDLSCNNKSQLLLHLPFAEDFVVTDINYVSHIIYFKLEFCPSNAMQSSIPLLPPFYAAVVSQYTFFNCSSNRFFPVAEPFETLECFSGPNSTILVVESGLFDGFLDRRLPESCRNDSATGDIPVGFAWSLPTCEKCEVENRTCGFKNEETLELGCSGASKRGLSTAGKYGIIVGVGMPGLLLLIFITNYTRKKINHRTHMERHYAPNLPTTTIALPPPMFVTGLDKLTIDSYPMTVLGASKRLPKPSDSTCAICLSEYQPTETIRTVPECNHYFHSNCIDEWLKLNATCPVCRNSPEGSLGKAATPMSSSSPSTCLITGAKRFNSRNFSPLQYLHHHNNDSDDSKTLNPQFSRQNRSFTTTGVFNPAFLGPTTSFSVLNGSILARHMSSSSTSVGDGTGKIEYMSDVAGVLSDGSVEVVTQQAPVVSEVAVAAADSYFPVVALQYVIDYIHTYTGLPWWGSIAATTLLIRWLAVPVMINQLKTTSKLTLMRPKLEEIKQEMQDRGMSPTAVTEGQQRMSQLFKEYGVTPWSPLKGLLIQGPVFICFFLAIQNMVEKVPSFKEGGAFWFVDLTTPDNFYILPFLTALTFWTMVECNMQEGMEGNPAGVTMKKVMRVFALFTVPITMSFPKAIFCYWITSNLFSLLYGLVIRAPNVKKLLGIPIIPVAPVTTAQQSAFSFTEALKKYVQAQQKQSPPPANSSNTTSLPTQTAKPTNQNKPAVSSVLSQRIRSLENQVKGRKKGKK